MADIDKWFNVNENARIWSGHADSAQKQGWLYAPAAIRAIDEYKGSYQFKEWKIEGDGRVAFAASPGYPDLWIRVEDVTLEPFPDDSDPSPIPGPDPIPGPVPVPLPGDTEAGAALRVLVNFVANILRNLR